MIITSCVLLPDTKVAVKVEEILQAKSLVKDIGKMSPQHQTSSLEAFHSVINRFAPKNTGFSYTGMQCRWEWHSLIKWPWSTRLIKWPWSDSQNCTSCSFIFPNNTLILLCASVQFFAQALMLLDCTEPFSPSHLIQVNINLRVHCNVPTWFKCSPETSFFSYCRLYLAGLHFNENSDREQAVDQEGQPRFSVRFPKFKRGGHSVHMEKTNPTYGRISKEKLEFKTAEQLATFKIGTQCRTEPGPHTVYMTVTSVTLFHAAQHNCCENNVTPVTGTWSVHDCAVQRRPLNI